MARRIQFGGPEHLSRVKNALHVHTNAEGETLVYYGDGTHVLAVCERPNRGEPWAEVVGEDGQKDRWGTFAYADFFFLDEPQPTRSPREG